MRSTAPMTAGNRLFEPQIFTPVDPAFEARVRDSFARQRVMGMIGATLSSVSAGEVVIELPYRADLTQQHGYLHAAIVTAIVDNACGYAAHTLMPADAAVLTVELKVNFLSPAVGRLFLAHGRVIKPGRTITVATGEVIAETDAGQKAIAIMQGTMMTVTGREISG